MSENRRTRILVIDEEAAGDVIVETLSARGMDVIAVADPYEGIAKAKSFKPDLIFVSLLFRDSNGLKVSKQIREGEDLGKVPVVMLISFQGELDPRHTTAIGIVDVLVKPLDPQEIISKTGKILGQDSFSDGSAEAVPDAPVGERNEAVFVEEAILGGHYRVADASVFTGELSEDSVLKEPVADNMAEGSGIGGEPEELKEMFSEGDEGQSEPRFSEEDETTSGGLRKNFSSKGILIGAAVLTVAVIAIGGYGLRKTFYPSVKKAPEKAVPVQRENVRQAPIRAVVSEETETGYVRESAEKKKSENAAGRYSEKAVRKNVSGNGATIAAGQGFKFSAQAGAFASEKNAASLAEKLRKDGYDAFIEKDGGRTSYRVLVGRFNDRKQASEQVSLLQKKGVSSIVYRGKG